MKAVNIKHIDNLHTDAIRGLEFYGIELGILQTRLEAIAGANTTSEVATGVEHFQNQFIIHKEQMDELRHALHRNIQRFAVELVHTEGYTNNGAVSENESLYDKYLTEEKLFNELRHEFNRFAAKWM